jgi:hypothetical protein
MLDKKINVKVIALQEIWAVSYPELIQIPGFSLVTKCRSNGRGGGMGFYLDSLLNFKIIPELSPARVVNSRPLAYNPWAESKPLCPEDVVLGRARPGLPVVPFEKSNS